MRKCSLALATMAVALVGLLGDPRPGAARTWYPWCAQYADRSGITECSFDTFQQCRATVNGIGGSCVQNWYPAPTEPPRHRRGHPFYR